MYRCWRDSSRGGREADVVQQLTTRQEMILVFIRRSIRDHGYPPTLREIGTQMGIRSTNGVSDHLRALERKGYLRREDMKSRALRPVDCDSSANDDGGGMSEPKMLRVPLVGRVAAGPLTAAMEIPDQSILMDPALLRGGGEAFALKVRGDSMVEAGIHDGDILFVRRQDTANRGDIVVALVGDEVTVKRFFSELDQVRLQPANQKLAPILVRRSDLSTFKILGVAIGLFRTVTGGQRVA